MKRGIVAVALVAAAAAVLAPATAIAAGPNQGGGGGGGTGGGGAGGGGTTNGAITTVGIVLSCDNGSGIAVTLQKGFQKRVEVVITPTATGIVGGRWEVHVDDVTHAQPILGFATTLPSTTALRLTSLGAGVPVGASAVTVVATRRDVGSTIDPAPLGPLLETCAGGATVVGR